jgi:ABC-type multidrug transport system fused ATPase/permease subunit
MTDAPDDAQQDSVIDRGGKSVQDFQSDGILVAVRRSLALLPKRQQRRLFLAAGVQVSLNLLDLLGIAMIGLLAAIAASGIGSKAPLPSSVTKVFELVGLEDLTVSQMSVIVAVAAVGVLVLKTALQAIMSRRIFRFLANRQADVSADLARRFLSRPLLFVQRWTTSEAIYALGGGVGSATVAVLGSAITILAEVSLFVIVIVTLLVIDPIITVVAVVLFATVVGLSYRSLTKRGQKNAQVMTGASIDTLSAVSEALQTYRETTVLNRRELYISKYQSLVGRYAQATASNAYIMEVPKYVLEATLYVAVLALGVVQFLVNKNLTAAAATVAVFLAAGMRMVPALLRLQGAAITIRNASVSAQPTFYLADALEHGSSDASVMERASQVESGHLIRARIAAGHGDFDATVVVEGAYVTYLDAGQPALIDASLTVPPGTSVALVGSTGAGKSTLADVIIGVLEPDAGLVTISGVPPREAIARWSGAIAYVPQAVALVIGSVRENVALGLPADAIDDDMVWDALERAHLADFLRNSREGLDTFIGERGVRLSGGQRQRLGVARALYTRPRLLVLDEATSALDAETEQAIIKTLDALEGQVTTVTVAHRLATVRRADQLLYLEEGRIVCRGTFEEVRSQVRDFDRQASLLGL